MEDLCWFLCFPAWSSCYRISTIAHFRYALPLFFVGVKTNTIYQPVAAFLTRENTSSIKEALEVLQQANPSWHPKSFMTDYDEAEIQAVKGVFPSKPILEITLSVNIV